MADADAPDRPADGALATQDDPDDVVDADEETADGTEDEAPARPRRRRRALDGRTLLICFLVAAIAALVAGLAASAVIDDGDDAAGGDQPGEATLSTAEQVPDVPLERFDGTPLSIADYRGQALVVNFWGSWCQPCVKEMPDLQRVHESLGDDVAFLGVNVRDNDPADALEMIERTGVTYDVAIDPDGELIRELGVVNFPTTVLILPDGTIVDAVQRQISAERLCDKINQSLLSGQLEECG